MSQVTKRALEASLKNLLLKKPLNKITINDITEDCGINRMTFYYHFQDIYALVEWMYQHDAVELIERNNKAFLQGEVGTRDDWEDAVRENKPFIINVYHCVDKAQVEKYLTPLTDDLLLGVVEEESQAMTVREEDKKFIAQIYSYCFIGIMLDWIKEDMKEEPEVLAEKLALVLEGDIRSALKRFCLSKS